MQTVAYPFDLDYTYSSNAWDIDVRSQYFAYGAAKVLRNLDQGKGRDGVQAVWDEMKWDTITMSYFEKKGITPGCCWSTIGDKFVGFMVGTSDKTQVAAQTGGYLFPEVLDYDSRERQLTPLSDPETVYFNLNVCNKLYWTQGKIVSDYIKALSPRPAKIILCGHSYGGAIATVAAIQLIQAGVQGVSLMTFGAPMVGTERFYWPLRGTPFIRWMNVDDPIPSFPYIIFDPHVFFKTQVAPGVEARYQYTQPPLGFLIAENGLITSSQFGTGPAYLQNAFDKLDPENPDLGGFDFHFIPHYLTTYAKRLKLLMPTGPRHIYPGGARTPAERIAAIRGGGVLVMDPNWTPPNPPRTAVPVAPMPSIVRIRERPPEFKVAPPDVFQDPFARHSHMAYVPRPYSSRRQKIGDNWTVVFESTPIATGTRSQCVSFVKAYNHFLRRMQAMESFSQTNFPAAFNLYLSEASAGGAGFKPDVLVLT